VVLRFRAGMALSTTRLRREFKELQKNPLQNIRAAPKETNVLEWHYVIIGQEKTDYADGYYHGTVVFPSEYPYKPPTIRMMTPSGRFKVPF
jgi:ubiquitin-conjugating enzyme E2 J2